MSQPPQTSKTSFKAPNIQPGISLTSKHDLYQFFNNAKGTNLFSRYYPAEKYIQQIQKDGLWLEKRQLKSAPLTEIIVKDPQSKLHKGLNFASNNYLGLANHPFTIEAGIEAAKEFGVNSAGSPLAFGSTKYYAQLKEEVGECLGLTALLFSSGWLSCFGFIKSLVKDYDHILIDELADRALFEGARYTTRSVHTFKHLDEEDLKKKLKELRTNHKNGIMVITDCLFSADSSSPNLVNYQKLASQYQAYLLLNIGHDFGVYGPNARGVWQEQGLKDLNNVLFVGSGSKTLGVNFAFMGLPGEKYHYIYYWKYFCSTYMFTNAINPIQSNSGLAALRIARSHLGNNLREKVLSNGDYLRESLKAKGYQVLGRVSPFVCVRIGNEGFARIIAKTLMENDIFVNVAEYPDTKVGEANIRMSLTPEHTLEQMDRLVEAFDWSYNVGKKIVEKEVHNLQVNAKKSETAKL